MGDFINNHGRLGVGLGEVPPLFERTSEVINVNKVYRVYCECGQVDAMFELDGMVHIPKCIKGCSGEQITIKEVKCV